MRLLRWDLERGGDPEELIYVVEAVSVTPPEPAEVIVNGLVEMIALDHEALLTLERQWVPGVGIEMKLYAVSLAGAPNVAAVDPPATQALPTATKTLLRDFAKLGLPLDNFEGMAFGPPLADGRRGRAHDRIGTSWRPPGFGAAPPGVACRPPQMRRRCAAPAVRLRSRLARPCA